MGTPLAPEEMIRDFVLQILLFGGGGQELDQDYSFLDHGILDSMGVLELVAFLERSFGIRVADEEIIPENLDSIRQMVAFVRRKAGR